MRSATPICEGVRPFFASLQMWLNTPSGFIFTQVGGSRRYGIADAAMPLPFVVVVVVAVVVDVVVVVALVAIVLVVVVVVAAVMWAGCLGWPV